MKHTNAKVNLAQLHQDLKNLNDKDFEKRYPGIKKEQLRGLSDAEIEKMAGGVTVTWARPSSWGTFNF